MAIAIEGLTSPLLHVYDIPVSVAFYRDLLGFEVIQHSVPRTAARDDYGWALLRLGVAELMLNNMYEDNVRPAQPDPARSAAHGDTCLYFSCPDVDAAYAYLKSKGVHAREPFIAYYGMKQCYLKDPDGYSLCFQTPV